MVRLFLLYTALRLLVVGVIAGVLVAIGVPAAVAVLIAIVLGFGLSVVLFRGLRARLEAELAATGERRRAERARLRRALRGDDS